MDTTAADTTTPPATQHPEPPYFHRWEEALFWLTDCGWRQVGDSRGTHFRLEHPAYTHALQLIRRGSGWERYEQRRLEQTLRRLDATARRRAG